MPTPAPRPVRAPRADDARATGIGQDLEEFWPSRRGHAYDEFCR